MRERIPNTMSSIFVKMKALMALVSFWIFRSRLGTATALAGDKNTKMTFCLMIVSFINDTILIMKMFCMPMYHTNTVLF